MSDVVGEPESVRTAEVVAALCLATDLGMGFPFEHGLRTVLIATKLADRLGVDAETASQTYYAGLLSHAGCTTDAHVTADIFGGSLTTHFNPVTYGSPRQAFAGIVRALPPDSTPAPLRAMQVVRRLPKAAREKRPHFSASCEVAQKLAEALDVPATVPPLLAYLTDRWDGKGPLERGAGEEIPLPMRIVHVAVDAAFQRMLGGDRHALQTIGERAGRGFDPTVAACLVDNGADIFAVDDTESTWDETLALEPSPRRTLEGGTIDRALAAAGDFADLISPCLSGHSTGVADLAAAAARLCRLDEASVVAVRRAGLLHDLGRVATGARIWQKPGRLTADEWEQVRLHAYHTQRVLARSPFLAALAPIASAHHERLDGSGYHRGAIGADLSMPARLVAAADAYHAMTEPRPHRAPLSPERAAGQLAQEASAGCLDADAVVAVVKVAGQPTPPIERPAGLTEREVEVIGLLARGLQTKQVARRLGIAVKTADRHVQNAYAKIGVSSRAAATLFAMEHGLVAWGELPMARQPSRP